MGLEASIRWCEDIGKEETYWQETPAFPAILRKEREDLHLFFSKGQPSGALMQLKDIVELLIKVPVTLTAAYIINERHPQPDDAMYDAVGMMLQKNLSLGTWVRIARTMKDLPLGQPALTHILTDIEARCGVDETSISEHRIAFPNWRNRHVGHGALEMDFSEQTKREMTLLLQIILDHYAAVKDDYASIGIYVKTPDAVVPHDDILSGEASVPAGGKDTLEVFCKVGDGVYYSVSPFMEVIEGRLYLFDNFNDSRSKNLELLDYVEAEKRRKAVEKLDRMHKALDQRKTSEGLDGKGAAGGRKSRHRTHRTSQEPEKVAIDRNNMYIPPNYVLEQIKAFVQDRPKGVLLLQMEAGMGKSMITKSLDRGYALKERPDSAKLEGVSVRTYYIHEKFASSLPSFWSTMQQELYKNDSGENFTIDDVDPFRERDFARALNIMHEVYEDYSYDDGSAQPKLLVAIDGLDEIGDFSGTSIVDILPAPGELDDGVYVLLTCRTDDEIPAVLQQKLARIAPTKRIVIGKDDARNRQLVDAYMKEALPSLAPDVREEVAAIVDGRILRANLLRYIPEKLGDYTFLTTEDICRAFIDKLELLYAAKYFRHAKRLLLILAMSDLPLTATQLAELLDEGEDLARITGELYDLAPFLDKRVQDDSVTYMISHKVFRDYILHHFDKEAEELAMDFVRRMWEIAAQEKVLTYADWLTTYFALRADHNMASFDLCRVIHSDIILYRILRNVTLSLEHPVLPETYFGFIILEIVRIVTRIHKGEKIGAEPPFADETPEHSIKKAARGETRGEPDKDALADLIKACRLVDTAVALGYCRRPDVGVQLLDREEPFMGSFDRPFMKHIRSLWVKYRNDLARQAADETVTVRKEAPPITTEDASDFVQFLRLAPSKSNNIFHNTYEYALATLEILSNYLHRVEDDAINRDIIFVSLELLEKAMRRPAAYDEICSLAAEELGLSEQDVAYLHQFRTRKDLSLAERNIIHSFCLNVRFSQNALKETTYQMDFRKNEIIIRGTLMFDWFAIANAIDALYHLLRGGRFLREERVISSSKIYYSLGPSCLSLVCLDRRRNLHKVELNGRYYHPKQWKMHTFDEPLRALGRNMTLHEATLGDLRGLLDNHARYFDYAPLAAPDTPLEQALPDSFATEETIELFPAQPHSVRNLADIIASIRGEYDILVDLLDLDPDMMPDESVAVCGEITEQHRAVLQEFIRVAKRFEQACDSLMTTAPPEAVEQGYHDLRHVCFDLQLVELLTRELEKRYKAAIDRWYH